MVSEVLIDNPAGRLISVLRPLSRPTTHSQDMALRLRDAFGLERGPEGTRAASTLLCAALDLPNHLKQLVLLHDLDSELAAVQVSSECLDTLHTALANLGNPNVGLAFSDATEARLSTWSYSLHRRAPEGPASPDAYRTLRDELSEFRAEVASLEGLHPQLLEFVLSQLDELVSSLRVAQVVGPAVLRRSVVNTWVAAHDPHFGGLEVVGAVRDDINDSRNNEDRKVADGFWTYLGRISDVIGVSPWVGATLLAATHALGITGGPSAPTTAPPPAVVVKVEVESGGEGHASSTACSTASPSDVPAAPAPSANPASPGKAADQP